MTRPFARIAVLAAAAVATGIGVLVVHASAQSHPAPFRIPDSGANSAELTAFDGPLRCPTRADPPPKPTVPRSDAVPAGAVDARLCPVLGPGHRTWSAPLDMLVGGADGIAQVYNELPQAQPLPCAPLLGKTTAFSISFMYKGGAVVRLEADSTDEGGCSPIGIDGRHDLGRADAGTMLAGYLHALAVQRAAWRPPVGAGSLPSSCVSAAHVTAGIIPAGPDLGLSRAVVCVRQVFPGDPGHFGVLTPAQVSQLNAGYLANHSHRVPPGVLRMNPDPPADVIVGRTAWGDVVVLHSACYDFARQVGTDQRTTYWQPTTQDQTMLDQAAGA